MTAVADLYVLPHGYRDFRQEDPVERLLRDADRLVIARTMR